MWIRKLAKKTITADTRMGTQSDRMGTMRTSRLGARLCRAGVGSRVREDPLASAPRAGEQGSGAAVKPGCARRAGGWRAVQEARPGVPTRPAKSCFSAIAPVMHDLPRSVEYSGRTKDASIQTSGTRIRSASVQLIMWMPRSFLSNKLRQHNATLVALFL